MTRSIDSAELHAMIHVQVSWNLKLLRRYASKDSEPPSLVALSIFDTLAHKKLVASSFCDVLESFNGVEGYSALLHA